MPSLTFDLENVDGNHHYNVYALRRCRARKRADRFMGFLIKSSLVVTRKAKGSE